MKIYPISNNMKKYAGFAVVTGTLFFAPMSVKASNSAKPDTFQKTQTIETKKPVIPLGGSTDVAVLSKAPSCEVMVQGVKQKAVVVVDVSKNILYKYDNDGNPEIAFPIASGKPSTPTETGLRRISHVEVSPYKKAPPHTKRHRNPAPYGKRVIILDKYDPVTLKIESTGEFIHGTNDETSIGKYVSNGCMRMPNEAVIYLANQVKRGQLVLIK